MTRTPGTTGTPIVYLWDAEYPWDVRAEKICRSLTDAGYDMHVVARNRRWDPVSEQLPEATVHRLTPLPHLGRQADGLLQFPAFFNPRWIGATRKVLSQTGARLLIVRDLPLAPLGLRVAAPLGIPVILDMAEDYPALLQTTWDAGRCGPVDFLVRNPRLAAWVERFVLPRLTHILAVVDESRDRLLRAGVPPERVSVVSNTPPLARLSTRATVKGEEHAPLEAIYLGIVEIPRGICRLVDAAALLQAAQASVKITIVGGGRDLDFVRRHAGALELPATHLTFTGAMAHEEALERVTGADIGLVPHLRNRWMDTTIPNKLFDFMAAGLPVVASDAAPLVRVLQETGCGLVAPDATPEALAAALTTLAGNAELRHRMSEAGRAGIRARYHWEADERVLLGAVSQVISGAGL